MLIGDFGMVARLGLRELLEDDGLEVVAEAQLSVEIIPWVNEVRPDVVMLDLDADAALEVAARIASEFPAIKVIACSAEEPVMRVFPPFHHGESYASPFNRQFLGAALPGVKERRNAAMASPPWRCQIQECKAVWESLLGKGVSSSHLALAPCFFSRLPGLHRAWPLGPLWMSPFQDTGGV